MIIDYDHNQNLNTDRKLDSLKESVQMALNETDSKINTLPSWAKESTKPSYSASEISNLGTVKYAQLTSNKSVPSGTATMLTSISLEAGVWVITAGVRWATNASGERRMSVTTTSGGADMQQTVAPVSNNWTQTNLTRIEKVNSTTTYYLNGYQTSGSTINAIGAGGTNYGTYITAVRIK